MQREPFKLDAAGVRSASKASMTPQGFMRIELGDRRFGYVNRQNVGWGLENPTHAEMIDLLRSMADSQSPYFTEKG